MEEHQPTSEQVIQMHEPAVWSPSPKMILTMIVLAAFFSELFLMLTLMVLSLPLHLIILLDSTLLILIISPVIYWLVYRPMSRQIVELRESAAKLSEKEAALRQLSMTDSLTGLYNRLGFMRLGEKQISLANRSGDEVFLLFIDLDNLKQVNDNLGHDEGDALIIEMAKILQDTFRKSDIVGRLGGDEYVVLMTSGYHTNERSILVDIEERILNRNAMTPKARHISYSAGIAKRNREHPESLEALITMADNLMYQEKHRKKRDSSAKGTQSRSAPHPNLSPAQGQGDSLTDAGQ